MTYASRALAVVALFAGCLTPTAPAAEPAPAASPAPATRPANHPLDVTVATIRGEPHDLGQYRGRVLLIVNVASRCAYTPQYAGLERLYRKYRDRGLVVLAFPSNDFGNQEPGTNEQIEQYVDRTFHVTFPMMAKLTVKGPDKHSLYKTLTRPADGGELSWNFTKVLIGRNGRVAGRFPSSVQPEDPVLTAAIEAALAQESTPPTGNPPPPAAPDHAGH
jgi:glutathione peroxidase